MMQGREPPGPVPSKAAYRPDAIKPLRKNCVRPPPGPRTPAARHPGHFNSIAGPGRKFHILVCHCSPEAAGHGNPARIVPAGMLRRPSTGLGSRAPRSFADQMTRENRHDDLTDEFELSDLGPLEWR